MAANHPLLKLILPARVFAAVRAGTKCWLAQCPCGHRHDLWDAGGVRFKAAGRPRQLMRCPHCQRATLQRIRRKTDQERLAIP